MARATAPQQTKSGENSATLQFMNMPCKLADPFEGVRTQPTVCVRVGTLYST